MDWKTELKGEIKVRVVENSCGFVTIFPVNQTDRELISQSNEYDGSSEVFIHDSQDVRDFLESYPKARYRIPKSSCDLYGGYIIGRYAYVVNDGVEFYIDSWEYRHMVGGQSD